MTEFYAAGKRFPLNRTYVMGILNVTPDSFSDGGKYFDPEKAVRHAVEMEAQGVDIVDIGGQSTRPGSVRISPEEEWARIENVVKAANGAHIRSKAECPAQKRARRARPLRGKF